MPRIRVVLLFVPNQRREARIFLGQRLVCLAGQRIIQVLVGEEAEAVHPVGIKQAFQRALEDVGVLDPLAAARLGAGVAVLNARTAVHGLAAGQPDVQPDAAGGGDVGPAGGQLVKRARLVQEPEVNLRQNIIQIPLLRAPCLDVEIIAAFEIAQIAGGRTAAGCQPI